MSNIEQLNVTTFHAYTTLLLLAGVYRSCGKSIKSLWDNDTVGAFLG